MSDDRPPDNPFVASNHPYPRQTLTPAPTTTPDWARIPTPPEPPAHADAWAIGWNCLTYAYFAARRALAADGPAGVPCTHPTQRATIRRRNSSPAPPMPPSSAYTRFGQS